MSKVLLITILLILFSCQFVGEDIQRKSGIDLKKGYASLNNDLSEMINPIGVLPNECSFSGNNISKKNSFNYYEFFAAGRDTTIVILSANPMYYLKIDSGEFYFHLMNEKKQIDAGILPKDKKINTIPFYKNVGNFRIEIYFTPTEMKYISSGSNKNRIGDNNATTDVDLYKLYQAAGEIDAYIPQLNEQTILQDFSTMINSGKDVNIFTDNSTTLPAVYFKNSSLNFPFSFISGENLALTDDLLGNNSLTFADVNSLTENFIFFLSAPPGNSLSDTENYLYDGDNGKHGIGVIIRGDISRLKEVLSYEGFDFNFTGLIMTLFENNSDPVNITLDWTNILNVKVQRKKTNHKDGSGTYVDIATITSDTYLDSGLERGYDYYYRLLNASDDSIIKEGFISIPDSPEAGDLIFTEICWMGIEDSYDEWIEFKNTSSKIISLSDVKFYVNGELKIEGEIDTVIYPGEYFVIARSEEKFFNIFSCSNLFIDGFGNLSNSSVTSMKFENSSGVEICSANSDPSYGDKDAYKMQVLDNDGSTWKTSIYDTTGITEFGVYAGSVYCTPGFSAADEY